MKAVLCVFLCLVLLIMIPTFNKVGEGYYFSMQRLVDHLAKEFPVLSVDWNGDFLAVSGGLIHWCGGFITWLFSFDPWVKGVPDYRGVISWHG